MYYLVQKDLYRNTHEEKLMWALDRLGFEWEYFRHIPSVDKLEYETNRTDVFLFGSVKASMIAQKNGFFSYYNQNHDYNVYSNYYGTNLLNYDSKIENFGYLDQSIFKTGLRFIRPTEDTKTFTGKLYSYDEWTDFVTTKLTNKHKTSLDRNTFIQISSPKPIYEEIRCFVLNKKVITASTYKLGNTILYKENISEDIIDFVQQMCDIFVLNNGFVMDVCRTVDKLTSKPVLKIVECGCLNCAGFYDINILKLLYEIETTT